MKNKVATMPLFLWTRENFINTSVWKSLIGAGPQGTQPIGKALLPSYKKEREERSKVRLEGNTTKEGKSIGRFYYFL